MTLPFVYELPVDRIAQRPVYPYHNAKLLCVDRAGGSALSTDSTFLNIADNFRAGDLIVFNNSKVIPARLFGQTEDSKAKIEVLIHQQLSSNTWTALGRPMKKLKEGRRIIFSENLSATIVKGNVVNNQVNEVHLTFESKDSDLTNALNECGIMPIPPYIRQGRSDEVDKKDYQTPFAKLPGSIAAPTASLHFTPEVVERIQQKGVAIAYVTLHLGPASFLPIFDPKLSDKNPDLTPPSEELLFCTGDLKEKIITTKKQGGRVIGVGTSVVRALETIFSEGHVIKGDTNKDGEFSCKTALFITPGFKFMACDIIVTNFHQPATSHLLLVEAFMGSALLEHSYNHALSNDYRFLSYGDGMMIV